MAKFQKLLPPGGPNSRQGMHITYPVNHSPDVAMASHYCFSNVTQPNRAYGIKTRQQLTRRGFAHNRRERVYVGVEVSQLAPYGITVAPSSILKDLSEAM